MYLEIHQLRKKGLNISQIGQELKISRPTVYQYLGMSFEEAEEWCLKQGRRKKILDPYQDWIVEWLREHPHLSAAQIKDWLLERFPDLKVGDSTVRLYVNEVRETFQISKQATERQYDAVQELPMGKQMQVDWGETIQKTTTGGRIKLYVICFVLSHSRQKYMFWQDRPFNTQDAIIAHEKAFQYYGGRTEEMVYDQDRIISVEENAGDIVLTQAFQQYVNDRGFEVVLCRAADPESKGKIESVVKYVKYNFADSRVFSDMEDWNERSLAWLKRTGNHRKHEVTKKRPEEVFALEQAHLLPVSHLNTLAYVIDSSITRKIRKDNTVMYQGNRYSVPLGSYKSLPDNDCTVVIEENYLQIYHPISQEMIAEHPLCLEKGKLIQKQAHKRDRSASSRALKEGLVLTLKSDPIALDYLETVCRHYPRYQKDQLKMIEKTVKEAELRLIIQAMTKCQQLGLYSANDLRQVLLMLKQKDKTRAEVRQPTTTPSGPKTYTVATRSMDAYTAMLEGREAK